MFLYLEKYCAISSDVTSLFIGQRFPFYSFMLVSFIETPKSCHFGSVITSRFTLVKLHHFAVTGSTTTLALLLSLCCPCLHAVRRVQLNKLVCTKFINFFCAYKSTNVFILSNGETHFLYREVCKTKCCFAQPHFIRNNKGIV